MSNSTAHALAANNGRLSRQVQTAGQLWQVPVFVLGAIALAVVAFTAPLAIKPEDNSLEKDLNTIRHVLQKPGAPTADLVALAESAVARSGRDPDPERVGEARYLLGTIYLRLAARANSEDGNELRQKATVQLELAEMRGVSNDDKPRLQYQRGKLIFMNNGDMSRVADLLQGALPGGADYPAEGYAILTEALLRKVPPDIDKALAANQKLLETCDEKTALAQARFQRGELLLQKQMRPAAIAILELITAKDPAPLRLKARLLMARAAMDEGLWKKAIPLWNEMLASQEPISVSKARILYNLGLCYRAYESPAHNQEARSAWERAESMSGEESQAAAFKLAEMDLAGDEPARAFQHFQKGLDKVHTRDEFKNTLVTAAQAKGLVDEACRVFEAREDNEDLQRAAELLKKLATPGAADEKIAQALEKTGIRLLEQAKQEGAVDPAVLLVRAHDALQNAALAYERAAEKRTPADSVGVLWQCSECYRLAEEPTKAVAILRQFVNLPAPPLRKAEAFFVLGEMQRQLKKTNEARESYKQCVAFNNDAFTARALLHLAEMALEDHNLTDAEAVLVQVVYPPAGIADRATHQTAMLMLVNLFYQQRQFDKASQKCKELIREYPGHPFILSVREQLGQCYRFMAQEYLEKSKAGDSVGESKAYFQRERQKNLEYAKDVFQELATDLDVKASVRALPLAEESLRRKAALEVADCYFELPNWFEEAFRRYFLLSEKYAREPEGLRACEGLCNCLSEAIASRHPETQYILEAADKAVEDCIKNFDAIDRAGAFKTPELRERYSRWLEECKTRLKDIRQKS